MSEAEKDGEFTVSQLRTTVRFTKNEYLKAKKMQLESGHSIPWLLKIALFERGISPPTLDNETRDKIQLELSRIGTNVNQIAKSLNSGIFDGMAERFLEHINDFRMVRSFLGLGYGDRKNSV